MCITAVLLYQYSQLGGRRGKNEKYVIMTTLDPNPNPNPNWNAMGCDGTALEGR